MSFSLKAPSKNNRLKTAALALWLLFCNSPNYAEDKSATENKAPYELIIGASVTGLREQKAEDIKLGFESALNQVLAAENIHSTFIFYKNPQLLAAAIADNQVNAMFGSPAEYLASEKYLTSEPIISGTFVGHDKSSYLILVRKDSGIDDLAQLKGKLLSSPLWVYSDLGKTYLENILLEKKLALPEKFFAKIEQPTLANQSISKLFFKQVDAIMIRSLELEVAGELNPQIKQSFKTIESSEPYLIFLAASLKTTDEFNAKNTQKTLYTMSKTVKGRNILNLMRISDFHPVKHSDFDNIEYLLKKNKELKEVNHVAAP